MLLQRQHFVEPYPVRVYSPRRRLRLDVQFCIVCRVCRRGQQQQDAPRDSYGRWNKVEKIWGMGGMFQIMSLHLLRFCGATVAMCQAAARAMRVVGP